MQTIDENAVFGTLPRINRFSIVDYQSCFSREEHVPATHEFLYVVDGKMALHFGRNLVFHAAPGDFLLIPARMPHRDEFVLSKGLRILMVQFSWEQPHFFQLVTNNALAQLSYAVRAELRRRLEFSLESWEETPRGKNNASVQLHAMLMLIFNDILNRGGENVRPGQFSEQEAMRWVRCYLKNNYASQVTLAEAAEQLGINPCYLSKKFHREYGIGFCQYLMTVRLEAAKRLLIESRLQVAEVAERCGFSSSSYFIKVFSRHFGRTPRDFASGFTAGHGASPGGGAE